VRRLSIIYIPALASLLVFSFFSVIDIRKNMKHKLAVLASIAVPFIAFFLLVGLWTTFVHAPHIAFTVAGFYGFGSMGLLLMYQSHKHLKNPNVDAKKAWIGLFLGLVLVLVSYSMLEFILRVTIKF